MRNPQTVSSEFLESVGYGHTDEAHPNYRWNPVDDMVKQQEEALANLSLTKKNKKKEKNKKRKQMQKQMEHVQESQKTDEEEDSEETEPQQ